MTKLEFIDKINDILIGLNTAESDALGSLYDELMRDAGWHPVSELPPEEGEYITIMSNSLGEHGEICYNDFSNGEWRYIGYDWEPRKVLLWCYPPRKE